MSNSHLQCAKDRKNDEFYTQYEDIAAEMANYEPYFEGKVVYCNCDDPNESNFAKYFINNFNKLRLKKLICTGYKVGTTDSIGVIIEKVPEGFVIDI